MTSDRRRRVVTGEEARLWQEVMRGTRKLLRQSPTEEVPDVPAAEPSPKPAAPPSSRPHSPRQAAKKAAVSLAPPDPVFPVPPSFSFQPATAPPLALDHRRAPGLDKSTAGRFAKGMMEIDATIDLHGLTQPVAHAALARFINGSTDIGRRCLLVITGKGNREGAGILRAEVPRWLNEPALRGQILAFTHAQPKHGGGGALYVLLKRRR